MEIDEPDLSFGWREEVVVLPDGGKDVVQIPLTVEERLHPEPHFIIPEPTLHDLTVKAICDMLRSHCRERHPTLMVARNLLIKWDKAALRKHAPDISVIPIVLDRHKDWATFHVAKEKTRPCLIIEVVPPGWEEIGRVVKVDHYARANVQEYVWLAYWEVNGQTQWEMMGYVLDNGRYRFMQSDKDGAIHCKTVGVRIGVRQGKVWMENYETGERLLTNIEARLAAKAQLAEVEAARQAAEARIAELEAQLKAFQQK